MKHFKAIAAMAENRVIGSGNRIPWHLPEDFQWFKKMTTGQTIVMGRRTFESIGRPLPNRRTIVISRSGFAHPGVETLPGWKEIDLARYPGEVFICGGAQLYAQTLDVCSDLYLTHVRGTPEGDAFFPEFERDFEVVAELSQNARFTIVHYRNRRLDPRLPAGTAGLQEREPGCGCAEPDEKAKDNVRSE